MQTNPWWSWSNQPRRLFHMKIASSWALYACANFSLSSVHKILTSLANKFTIVPDSSRKSKFAHFSLSLSPALEISRRREKRPIFWKKTFFQLLLQFSFYQLHCKSFVFDRANLSNLKCNAETLWRLAFRSSCVFFLFVRHHIQHEKEIKCHIIQQIQKASEQKSAPSARKLRKREIVESLHLAMSGIGRERVSANSIAMLIACAKIRMELCCTLLMQCSSLFIVVYRINMQIEWRLFAITMQKLSNECLFLSRKLNCIQYISMASTSMNEPGQSALNASVIWKFYKVKSTNWTFVISLRALGVYAYTFSLKRCTPISLRFEQVDAKF